MEINNSQLKAIKHNKGPMLVLAGPGSGKTLVITRRVNELVENYGVNPNNILVITFTKAAAGEMKERYMKLTGEKNTGVNFGTFHAIYFTILKYAYNYNATNILRDETRNQFFKEIIEHLDIEIEDEKEFLNNISSEISLVKSERMDLNHYYSINCSDDVFKKIYNEYDNKLRRSNLIDFDDMLVLCYELLKARSDILAIWQNKYGYILIDEFQDINKIQYDIIRLLAKPQNNLFIVGDDDQSIYQFRGAKPDIMLNFNRDYPEAKQVLLNTNYRSYSSIVEKAASLIKNNTKRFAKEIISNKTGGEEPFLRGFSGLKEQNSMVVANILEYYKTGVSFSEMAILYRTNTQPRALLEKIMEYNIPFQMRDVIPNIYEHWISINIINYIKIAMGNMDRGLFLSISNRPKRYISREAFADPIVSFHKLREFYVGKDWMIERIDKLEYDLQLLKSMSPYAAINYIRQGIGYDEYMKEYAEFRRIKVDELLDTLGELQEGAKPFKTYEEWFAHIDNYKAELKRQADSRQRKKDNCVTLATMHSSKGLEYQVVFIVDANEGITPHRKAVLDADIEEERRLFYVAMTRAKEHLHIYWVKDRYNKELTCSRFIGEILLDKDTLKPSSRVKHKMYGEGTIKSSENGKLVIYFDRLKKDRTLDLEFCLQNNILTTIK
jgi:DNA helicase-2/ATP-dependent DNA helicase PcrA